MTPNPPSIAEFIIVPNKPVVYESYMYILTNILNGVWYLGIKKDLLPEDGGKPYWTSSTNDEFIELIQGSEPIFKVEILLFSDWKHLQQKEYMKLRTVSNIKTNPNTYNLSYGMPPAGTNGLPTEEYVDWFFNMVDSGVWNAPNKENIKTHLLMPAVQPRSKNTAEHITSIASMLEAVGNNTDGMNPILVFEGQAHKFKDESGNNYPKGDIRGGTNHGLKAAKRQKCRKVLVIRVPEDILADKDFYFIKALAAAHNKVKEIKLIPDFEDGAKTLVDLYITKQVEPDSGIAKDQLKILYNFTPYYLGKSVSRALHLIKKGQEGIGKWKHYGPGEEYHGEVLSAVAGAQDKETLAMYMSSAMYDYRKIMDRFYEDATAQFGLKRKKMKCFIHHPSIPAMDIWDDDYSKHTKKLKHFLKGKGYSVEFLTMETETSDIEILFEEE